MTVLDSCKGHDFSPGANFRLSPPKVPQSQLPDFPAGFFLLLCRAKALLSAPPEEGRARRKATIYSQSPWAASCTRRRARPDLARRAGAKHSPCPHPHPHLHPLQPRRARRTRPCARTRQVQTETPPSVPFWGSHTDLPPGLGTFPLLAAGESSPLAPALLCQGKPTWVGDPPHVPAPHLGECKTSKSQHPSCSQRGKTPNLTLPPRRRAPPWSHALQTRRQPSKSSP